MFGVLFYLFLGGLKAAGAVEVGTAHLNPMETIQNKAQEVDIKKADISNETEQQSPKNKEQVTDDKKWRLNFSHALSSGTVIGSRSILNNSLSGSYKYSQTLSLSASIAYIKPLGEFISDSKPYNWTDTSIKAAFPLAFPTFFLAQRWNGSMGISLPTSYKSRVSSSKWFSLFGGINHIIKQEESFTWSGGHTFYTGFYKYRTNRSGNIYNSLFSSFHSLHFNHRYKRLSLTAMGRLYLSFGLKRKSAGSFLKRFRPRGGQGLSFTLSYNHPKPEVSLFGSLNSNIPFISPVMTGHFPLLKISSWTYLLGLRWGI